MADPANPSTWAVPAIQVLPRDQRRFRSTMPGQPPVFYDFGAAVAPGTLIISRDHWTYILNQANVHAAAIPDAAVWGSDANVRRRRSLATMVSGDQLHGACMHFAAFALALAPPLVFAPANRLNNSPLGWLDCLLLARTALAAHRDGADIAAQRAAVQAMIDADPYVGPALPQDGLATVPPTAASITLARAAALTCRRGAVPRPHHATLRARLLATGDDSLLEAAGLAGPALDTEYRGILADYIVSFVPVPAAAAVPPPPVTVCCAICTRTVVDHVLVVPWLPASYVAPAGAAAVAPLPVCSVCVGTCLEDQTDATVTPQSDCWEGALSFWVSDSLKRECGSCGANVWRAGADPCPRVHLFGLPPVLPRAANDAVERDGAEPSLGSGLPVLRGVPRHAHSSWRTRTGSGAPTGASPRPRPRTGSTTSIRGCSGHAWLLRLLFSRSDARGAPYLGRGLAALRDRRHHVALFGLSRRGPLARGRSRSGGFAGNRLEPSPAVSGLNAPTCSPHPGD